MAYGVLALRCLGHEENHPLVESQLESLERLEIEAGGEMRLQPCRSPVWDTVLALHSLLDAGLDDQDRPIQESLEWLLDREIETWGDWREKGRHDAAGGAWCFYYRNDFYPDCDDTAAVLALFCRVRGGTRQLEKRRREARSRAVNWLLGMQNPDGGWGAFDRCCKKGGPHRHPVRRSQRDDRSEHAGRFVAGRARPAACRHGSRGKTDRAGGPVSAQAAGT